MQTANPLPFPVKLTYGIGELAAAVPVSLSAFFTLYFLTTIVGLSPALTGGILLFGRLWDAINDPLVGWLSDRTQSPLGRRFPWMLAGIWPLAICSILLWIVPPIGNQAGLLVYYAVLSLVTFAAFTAVQLPHTALAAQLSNDYDERTALISMKSAFSISGSLVGLSMAWVVFGRVTEPEQQYQVLGVLSAGLAILTMGICIAGTYGRYWQVQTRRMRLSVPVMPPSFLVELSSVFRNTAFRHILGLYLCGWMGIQLTAAMLPYFIDAWMNLPDSHFAQMALTVQSSAIAMTLVWEQVAKRSNKRTVFLVGAPLAIVALMGLATIQPGQLLWMYILGAVAGAGIATQYLVPFAMLPDVIDLDELETGLRREGLYFSAVIFLQKLGIALALFISGQLLTWTGFIANAVEQPTPALWTIRLLIGPLPSILMLLSVGFAYLYPINRQRHQQIVRALEERRR